MARALVTDPKLLLLDEPLAALDVSIKTNVRRLLREVLRQSSAANILVTHDLLDAVALSDRMIVIEAGAIVQTGTPAEVTARPRSTYVADLTGVNLLRGTAHGTVLDLDGGGRLTCASPAAGPTFAVIAPAAVAVSRERPEAGPEGREVNTWRGHVSAVDLMGDRVRVRVDGTPGDHGRGAARGGRSISSSTKEATCGCVSARPPSRHIRHNHRQEQVMKLSARNQIPARVTGIHSGEAIANVELDANGVRLVASITVEAVRQLGLKEGSEVSAVIKASDVIVATSG